MTFIKTAFSPALNKAGFCKLTFLGTELKQGVSNIKHKDTGLPVCNDDGTLMQRDWSLIKFNFDCMGKVRGQFQKINIACNPVVAESSTFATVLQGLGFEFPTLETELDEDGFEVVKTDLDDEDFEQVDIEEVDSLTKDIELFLLEIQGGSFQAKIARNIKGFWDIDQSTLTKI